MARYTKDRIAVSLLITGDFKTTATAGRNLTVERDALVSAARLLKWHGHVVASYHPYTGKVLVCDAGWRTPSTKWRINAVLDALVPGAYVNQQDWTWYLHYRDEDGYQNRVLWKGAAEFSSHTGHILSAA